MAPSKTCTLRGSCPADEELAAFLDATLSATEGKRITAHLARCERCYEVLANVADARSQLDQAALDHAAGQVVPFGPTSSHRSWHRRPWWPAAATAATLAVVAGIATHDWLSTPPSMVAADLVAPLSHTPRIEEHFYATPRMRSGHGETVPFSPLPSFLVGVFEVDLHLGIAAGDVDRSSRILSRIGDLLRDMPLMKDQAEAYEAESARLSSAAALRHLAAEASAREAALEGENSTLLPRWVDFGKWTEAARLAAASQTSAFFKTPANRRYLAFLLRGRLPRLDPELKVTLRRIESLWDLGRFAPADLAAFEAELTRVIARGR
ncbi:MAG TPA: zf-HC2 domain-containing protein [Thermoanaerobaculia bacterium]|jgi:hypothetical protein|nr:zf-HC2 domain-containing protein [Thermoanaerobaculia bacterium]